MSHYSFKADTQLQQILEENSELVTCKAGEILFKENDPGRGMYLIVRGHFDLLLHSAGMVTLMRKAGPGCLLGVPASINHHAYSLTAKATEDSELRFISSKALATLMKRDAQVTLQLVAMLSEEVRSMRLVIARPKKGTVN